MTGSRYISWTIPLAAMLALGAATPQPAVSTAPVVGAEEPLESTRIEVSLSERKLYVYTDGSVMNTFDVAIGHPDHPTPTGEFTIERIVWNPGWVPPKVEWADGKTKKAPDDPDNPMVAAKLFFKYPDYYIHGTDEPETLGEAASHGCLRMNPVDVKNLAEFVQTAGGEPRDDAWFERVQRNDGSDHEVTLPDPVEITIRH